ncbi:MAG: hypothetical protein P8170_18645 [Gemmatimonadota bacterium]
MSERKHQLVNIWGDAVDLRELLIGLAIGSAFGYAAYVLAFGALTRYFPAQGEALIKGYALLGGIVGCVVAAVLIGLFVSPKRHVRAADDDATDRTDLLRTLGLDPEEERQALEDASPKLIREMKQLQVYDLFADFARSEREED